MGQVGKLGVAGRMPINLTKRTSHPDVLSIPEVYYTICRYAMYILASRMKPLSIIEQCFVRGPDRLHYSSDRVGRKGRHDHPHD